MMDFLANTLRFGFKSQSKQSKKKKKNKKPTGVVGGNCSRNLPPTPIQATSDNQVEKQIRSISVPSIVADGSPIDGSRSKLAPNGRRLVGSNSGKIQQQQNDLQFDPNNNNSNNIGERNSVSSRRETANSVATTTGSANGHLHHHQHQAAASSSSSGYNSVATIAAPTLMNGGQYSVVSQRQHHYAAPIVQMNGISHQQHQDQSAQGRFVKVSTFRSQQQIPPSAGCTFSKSSCKPMMQHRPLAQGPPMVPIMIDDDENPDNDDGKLDDNDDAVLEDHHNHHLHYQQQQQPLYHHDGRNHQLMHHGSQQLIDGDDQFYGFAVQTGGGDDDIDDVNSVQLGGVDCADSMALRQAKRSSQVELNSVHPWNGFTYEPQSQIKHRQECQHRSFGQPSAINKSLKHQVGARSARNTIRSKADNINQRKLHLYKQDHKAEVNSSLPILNLHSKHGQSLYHQSSASFIYQQLYHQQQQQLKSDKNNHRAQFLNYHPTKNDYNKHHRSQFHSQEIHNQLSLEDDYDRESESEDNDEDEEYSDSVEHFNQLHSELVDASFRQQSNVGLVSSQFSRGKSEQINKGNFKQVTNRKMQSTSGRQHSNSPSDLRHKQQQHHHHHSSSKKKPTDQQLVPSGSGVNIARQQYLGNSGSGTNVKLIPRSLSSAMVMNSRGQLNGNRAANPELALGCCGKFAKFLLFISNTLFWLAGLALGAWGILALVEDHKYNLSQLLVFEPSSRMSLFQLLSWSFITLGCATILVGFCGCSALFKNNRWILGLYIFLILAIFALDLATGLLAIIFQERLVANVRLRLINKLRNEYGVQASFTAAIDFIQTKYECCGLDSHLDYDQSLWRLQRLGGFEATVARTCCHLRNTFDDQAHVNPRPINESMCQSSDVRFHQSYRYRRGCLDDLERLIRHKIWTFTIGCGAVGAVILISLMFATCFCRSIPNGGSRKSSASGRSPQVAVLSYVDNQTINGNAVSSKKKHHGGHYK